eukprot:1351548-Amorphochlora_amoeboformis.AAC.1
MSENACLMCSIWLGPTSTRRAGMIPSTSIRVVDFPSGIIGGGVKLKVLYLSTCPWAMVMLFLSLTRSTRKPRNLNSFSNLPDCLVEVDDSVELIYFR